MLPKTRELASIAPRNVRPFVIGAADVADVFPEWGKLGFSDLTPSQVRRMLAGVAMDDLQPLVTAATIATPIQFLQNWLPGFVNIITQARKIDDLIGIVTAGAWEDEEIVQGILEQLGTTVPYGDYTNV